MSYRKKEDNWVTIILTNNKGRIDKDLRKIAYSLKVKPEEKALATRNDIPDRLQQYSDLAVQWMQDYLRIDTTNPPGNEVQAAAFL